MCYNKTLSDFVFDIHLNLFIRFRKKNSLISECISAYISVSFLGCKYEVLSSKTNNHGVAVLKYGGVAVINL